MKYTLCLIILLPLFVTAQPFLGMALSTNSAELHGGYAFQDIEITATYKVPYLNIDIARIASINISKSYSLIDNAHYFTAGVGIANYKRNDVVSYHPNFRAEFGRVYEQGKLFILMDYCKQLFLMAGIKVYIK